MLFARINEFIDVHTPSRNVGQRVEKLMKERALPDWERQWEGFLDPGKDEMCIEQLDWVRLERVYMKSEPLR